MNAWTVRYEGAASVLGRAKRCVIAYDFAAAYREAKAMLKADRSLRDMGIVSIEDAGAVDPGELAE